MGQHHLHQQIGQLTVYGRGATRLHVTDLQTQSLIPKSSKKRSQSSKIRKEKQKKTLIPLKTWEDTFTPFWTVMMKTQNNAKRITTLHLQCTLRYTLFMMISNTSVTMKMKRKKKIRDMKKASKKSGIFQKETKKTPVSRICVKV